MEGISGTEMGVSCQPFPQIGKPRIYVGGGQGNSTPSNKLFKSKEMAQIYAGDRIKLFLEQNLGF